MVRYDYKDLEDKTKIPVDCTIFDCSHENLTELPEFPKSLLYLVCYNNNIKYLSPNNCEVIKKCFKIDVLNNPFSANFTDNKDFKEYLMNL